LEINLHVRGGGGDGGRGEEVGGVNL
jgi:hypothetical protein